MPNIFHRLANDGENREPNIFDALAAEAEKDSDSSKNVNMQLGPGRPAPLMIGNWPDQEQPRPMGAPLPVASTVGPRRDDSPPVVQQATVSDAVNPASWLRDFSRGAARAFDTQVGAGYNRSVQSLGTGMRREEQRILSGGVPEVSGKRDDKGFLVPGTLLRLKPEDPTMKAYLSKMKEGVTPLGRAGSELEHRGELGADYWMEKAEAIPAPKATEEGFLKGMATNPVGTLAATAGSAAPSVLMSYATAYIGAPAAVGNAFVMEYGTAYDDAIRKGAGHETANRHAFVVASINSVLEYAPAGMFLKRHLGESASKKLLANVFQQAGEEGITEALQEVTSISSEHLNDLEAEGVGPVQIIERILEAGTGGALAGGGMGAGGGHITGTAPQGPAPEGSAPGPLSEEDAALMDSITDENFDDYLKMLTGQDQGEEAPPPSQKPSPASTDGAEGVRPPAPNAPEETGEGPSPFMRHEQYLEQQLREKHGMSDEQIAGAMEHLGGGKDHVTGYFSGQHRMPIVRRAIDHVKETGQPGAAIEIDLDNLGGLNKEKGHEGADKIYREFADTITRTLEEKGADPHMIRHGGDELTGVVVGLTGEQTQAAMEEAQKRILEIAEREGLSDLPHHKHEEDLNLRGVGITFGAAGIDPQTSAEELLEEVDAIATAAKKARGQTNELREETGPAGPAAPEGQAGGTPEGVGPQNSGLREEVPGLSSEAQEEVSPPPEGDTSGSHIPPPETSPPEGPNGPTPQPPETGASSSPLYMEKYTEKSFIIRGETKEHRDRIKDAFPSRMRASFTKKGKGWIVPNSLRDSVKKNLSDLLGEKAEEAPTAGPQPANPPVPTQKKAARIRKSAEALSRQIHERRNPAVANQNLTRRRAAMIDHSMAEAERLERVQRAMTGVADAIEKGNLPESLSGIKSRADVEAIHNSANYHGVVFWRPYLNDLVKATARKRVKQYRDIVKRMAAQGIGGENRVRSYSLEEVIAVDKLQKAAGKAVHDHRSILYADRIMKMGIKNDEEFQAAKKALEEVTKQKPTEDGSLKIAKMERDLVGTKIPGFFPTPKSVVKEMVKIADIGPGMKVLEPSAGKGDIADMIRDTGADVDVVEVHQSLRNILEAKGLNLVGDDFLEYSGSSEEGAGTYDAVIMNPPFEKGQDMTHVRYAYGQLAPGGRLVSIMSSGPFFRNDKASKDFREWIDKVNAVVEDLPEGSFKGSESFRQTGVNAKMVSITKPKSAPTLFFAGIAPPPGSVKAVATFMQDTVDRFNEIKEKVKDDIIIPKHLRSKDAGSAIIVDIPGAQKVEKLLSRLAEDFTLISHWARRRPELVKPFFNAARYGEWAKNRANQDLFEAAQPFLELRGEDRRKVTEVALKIEGDSTVPYDPKVYRENFGLTEDQANALHAMDQAMEMQREMVLEKLVGRFKKTLEHVELRDGVTVKDFVDELLALPEELDHESLAHFVASYKPDRQVAQELITMKDVKSAQKLVHQMRAKGNIAWVHRAEGSKETKFGVAIVQDPLVYHVAHFLIGIQSWKGRIPHYVPHHRYGEFAIAVYSEDEPGRTFWFSTHEKNRDFNKTLEEVRKKYDPNVNPEFIIHTFRKPEEIYSNKAHLQFAQMESFLKAMELTAEGLVPEIGARTQEYHEQRGRSEETAAHLRGATENIMKTVSVPDAVKGEIKKQFLRYTMARGYGSHFIRRQSTKGIPGFSRDVQRAVADSLAQSAGWVGKVEKSDGFAEAWEASELTPDDHPRLDRAMQKYVEYNMDSASEYGLIKSLNYHMMLGGVLKSMVVNGTSQITMVIPELSKITKWPTAKLLKASKDWGKHKLGKGGISAEESAALEWAERTGELGGQLTEHITGQTQNPIYAALGGVKRGVTTVSAIGFSMVEDYNRGSTYLAAYRVFRSQGMKQMDAREAAIDLVAKVHFLYNKADRPGVGRGILSIPYQFKTWTHNYLTWVFENAADAVHGDRAATGALARNFTAQMVLGGITGLPLQGFLRYLLRKIFGWEAEEWVRKNTNSFLGRLLFRGVPAAFGLDLSGSLNPMLVRIEAKDLKDEKAVLATMAKTFMGAFSWVVINPMLAYKPFKRGDYARATEIMAPNAIKHPLAAIRLYTEGRTTLSGRPYVVDPDLGPSRLTLGEAIGKGVGFQPTRLNEQYLRERNVKDALNSRKDALDSFVGRFQAAKGDPAKLKAIWEELKQYNRKLIEKKRYAEVVSVEDVMRSVEGRSRAYHTGGSRKRSRLYQKSLEDL